VLGLTRYVLPKVNAWDPAQVPLVAFRTLSGVNLNGDGALNLAYM